METTQAAFGKISGQVAKGPVSRDEGAFGFIAATDEFKEQIGVAIGVRKVADLVDGKEIRCGVASQASAQHRIAVDGG